MKKIIILAIILLLTSCYSVKKAQKQVIKANVNYQEMFVDYIAKTYPTKDSIVEKIKHIKGDKIITIDTLYAIDCDSIVNDTIISNKIIYKKFIEKQVDTVYKEVVKVVTDRKLETKLKNDIKNELIKNAELKQKNKTFGYVILVLLAALILLIFVKR